MIEIWPPRFLEKRPDPIVFRLFPSRLWSSASFQTNNGENILVHYFLVFASNWRKCRTFTLFLGRTLLIYISTTTQICTFPPSFNKLTKKSWDPLASPEGFVPCEPGTSQFFCCILINGFAPLILGRTLFRDGRGSCTACSLVSRDAKKSSSDSNLFFLTTVFYPSLRMFSITFALAAGSSITSL